MHLSQNKNGLALNALIAIIILVVGFFFINDLLGSVSKKVDSKIAEDLCQTFNVVRYGATVETRFGTIHLSPKACRTIDKKEDLPSSEYKNSIEDAQMAAKAEIRDMMTRCWWMWLEGKQRNMFDKNWYNSKNGCFICYTFSIDKSAGAFGYKDFSISLNEPYSAADLTDRCAPLGEGGKCMPECDKNSDYFSKEVSSVRCPEKTKCCVAKNAGDECVDKGGKCMTSGDFEYNIPYSKWHCNKGRCFIRPDSLVSYYDYIQGTGGAPGGSGRILFAGDNEDDVFKSGEKYAITLVSPGKSFDWKTGVGLFTVAGGAAATVGGIILTGGAAAPIYVFLAATGTKVIAATTLYSAFTTANSGTVKDRNYILVSNFNMVSDKCAVDPSVGEE